MIITISVKFGVNNIRVKVEEYIEEYIWHTKNIIRVITTTANMSPLTFFS